MTIDKREQEVVDGILLAGSALRTGGEWRWMCCLCQLLRASDLTHAHLPPDHYPNRSPYNVFSKDTRSLP